jgi:hypothetical protein
VFMQKRIDARRRVSSVLSAEIFTNVVSRGTRAKSVLCRLVRSVPERSRLTRSGGYVSSFAGEVNMLRIVCPYGTGSPYDKSLVYFNHCFALGTPPNPHSTHL